MPTFDLAPPPFAPREFHVARAARDRYRFDQALFTLTGNVVFADFHAARRFAERMNARRDLARFPERAVRPGQIAALGLIDEITHWLFRAYCQRVNPRLLGDALAALERTLGAAAVGRTLGAFTDEFPPLAVYRGEATAATWLAGATAGESHRELALEELLMLWLANENPAFAPFRELFDDARLARETAYTGLPPVLRQALSAHPVPGELVPGAAGEHVLDLLRAPALAAPHSVEEQLRWLLARWGAALGRDFVYRVLTGMDVLKEEGRFFVDLTPHELRADELPVADYRGHEGEAEGFTADRDWMPRLVLLAKNAFVWLDQLSRHHGRSIATLAEIPDAELDELAARGITGLWLIGLWERSVASRQIKQLMGHADAVASAYSLYDYTIAHDLGGAAALADLRQRCLARGIRLASDMVPNHVGIDGRWVIEHPDWFVQTKTPPFPAYSFGGPDLSSDPRVAIQIEDHYWSRSDAAVVFRRIDRQTGAVRFLYHGNDGTNMPWNDTAQLDYLRSDVREAVIQTILHVARQFPIIRFDAAMTLAKRHFQRLWYPEPGSGGDIPSRAEHGLRKAQFDALMPQEFWREVVDRCAVEAPDTLLLAEAFWLMEGYFVRTLGMHRVYNSAFMVCLRDEENAKYRQILKNTMEFDPEILRRFVNFMNNPDERTAVDQFGDGDKYFGVCTMLATMPGLPMFGHGQVEGYAERYGMEYRRAYHDEHPNPWLIERHRREIFPLLHRRHLFAGVEHFLLYDFFSPEGQVDENVLAWSNGHAAERALLLFHNRHATTRGWVRLSAAFAERRRDGSKSLARRTLGQGLGLRGGDDDVVLFRDQQSGLEQVRASRQLCRDGLFVELGPYESRVLLDVRELHDGDGKLRALAEWLDGRGVPSIADALRELELQALHRTWRELLERLIDGDAEAIATAGAAFYDSAARQLGLGAGAATEQSPRLLLDLERCASLLSDEPGREAVDRAAESAPPIASLAVEASQIPAVGPTSRAFLAARQLGAFGADRADAALGRSRFDEWLLGGVFESHLAARGLDAQVAARALATLRVLLRHEDWHRRPGGRRAVLAEILASRSAQSLLHVNRHQGVLWFNPECFAELSWWLWLVARLTTHGDEEAEDRVAATIAAWRRAAASEFAVERLLAEIDSDDDAAQS